MVIIRCTTQCPLNKILLRNKRQLDEFVLCAGNKGLAFKEMFLVAHLQR